MILGIPIPMIIQKPATAKLPPKRAESAKLKSSEGSLTLMKKWPNKTAAFLPQMAFLF
jgi:hypothetical protein